MRIRNSVLLSKSVFANRKPLLRELRSCVQVPHRDLKVTITPSLLELQHLFMYVKELRGVEVVCLFDACPTLRTVSIMINNVGTIENALDFVTKIVQVAWMKEHGSELLFWFNTWFETPRMMSRKGNSWKA